VVEPAAPEPAVSATPMAPPPPPPVAVPPVFAPTEVEAEVVPFEVAPPAPVLASVATEAHVAESEPQLSFLRDREDVGGGSSSSGASGIGAAPSGLGAEPVVGGPGALTLDDGTVFALDTDYLIGRDPRQDPEVIAGVVKSLRVADPDGVISRRHARITVVAGQVRVFDLGSANGTFMELPGDPQRHRLTAGEPTVLTPGARVIMGRRWLRYDP
ncbi:FHA domain-containing protein, partial [Luedemannella flava]|uniref:FHA domain-containing protein n=1 Tax=Luedemannella flava TaxID=349316 RepID=UPI0031DE979F